MAADGRDLIFVDISALDSSGTFVANACDRVNVEVSGAGRLIGLDNGNSADFEQYKGTSRRLFSGKLLAIVAAKDEPGDINVKITSPSARGAELTLKALPADIPEGVSCIEENRHCPSDCPDEKNDIPIRRTELVGADRVFTPENKTQRFDVELFPKNAAYRDISYRLTCVNGIDTKLAKIVSSDENGVTVECISDGEFYLRTLCKNGGGRVGLMSVTALKGEGFGSAFHDPYTLTEGGLYTLSGGDVKNGIEHGVRTGLNGGWFGFENMDFGDVGTDRLTLPVFTETSEPMTVKVYDGTPSDGELIGELIYQKQSRWLELQSETYTLTKTLRGVHTVSVEAFRKADFGGIVFEKRARETAEIPAVSRESIYGDKFTVGDSEITGIGNNVIISFGEFDFTERSPVSLAVTGRTKLPVNSIQVMFEGEKSARIVCGFEGSQDYTEREFALSGITGRVKVSFIFLPGCDFDFRSFRFIMSSDGK